MERTGKGSHEIWEHDDLKFLARTHKIEPPANLKSNTAQTPWVITVPGDPATGTWNSLVKYAKWCQSTVNDIKARSANDSRRAAFAGAFNGAARRQTKRERKQERKARIQAYLNSGVHSSTTM